MKVDWLIKGHDRVYARKLLNYAKEYALVFEEPQQASVVAKLSKDKRRIVMAALANLAKYAGRYDYWKQIVANAGLKYEKKSAIDVAFGILNSDLHTLEEWLTKVLKAIPQRHASVLAFTAITGLRPSEGCMSTALITEMAEQDSLDNYFNQKLMMLEHFRYGKLFLRGNKNCYISFVPKEMLDYILEVKPTISYAALIHVLQRRRFRVRVKDLRHLHGTKLREHVPKEIVDLIHGRVGQSVFLRYYYEPFLNEVKQKVLRAMEPFTHQLLSTIN